MHSVAHCPGTGRKVKAFPFPSPELQPPTGAAKALEQGWWWGRVKCDGNMIGWKDQEEVDLTAVVCSGSQPPFCSSLTPFFPWTCEITTAVQGDPLQDRRLACGGGEGLGDLNILSLLKSPSLHPPTPGYSMPVLCSCINSGWRVGNRIGISVTQRLVS